MLAEMFPRAHARFLSLPLLGPCLEGFVTWLSSQGFSEHPIRMRIAATPRLERLLRRRRVRRLRSLTPAQLLAFGGFIDPVAQFLRCLGDCLRSFAGGRFQRHPESMGILDLAFC